jgi:hypothetical protein
MLGAVLKQHNSAPASRIRPERLAASRHFLQSRIPFSNSTFFGSKIQTSTYKRPNVTRVAVRKQGKKESKENSHRNNSQADSTMPRMKDSHSSLWTTLAIKLDTFSSREEIFFI